MRRFSAILGLSLCAGATAYLALAIRDAPALGAMFRQWGLVAALGVLAIVQALRSIRPWAAAGPALLTVAAGLVYLNRAAPQPPIAMAIEALGVGLIGLVLVVVASSGAATPRAASCKAILRGNRSRADHQLAPELHAVAVVGLADWDLATTTLRGPTDLNVTVVLGQVVLRLPIGCTWSTDEPAAGFWHQLRVHAPAAADVPITKARRGRAAPPHVQIHVLSIAGSVHVIASQPSTINAAVIGSQSAADVEPSAHP